jgi:hypothetical protein
MVKIILNQTIEKEAKKRGNTKTTIIDDQKKKRSPNQIIATSPKIAPVKNGTPSPAYFDIKRTTTRP